MLLEVAEDHGQKRTDYLQHPRLLPLAVHSSPPERVPSYLQWTLQLDAKLAFIVQKQGKRRMKLTYLEYHARH